MQEIIKWVERLVADELENANNEFPLFHSKHEAYGVLREEFLEAQQEWDWFSKMINQIEITALSDLDESAMNARKKARKTALYCIAEMIQNVAMLDKWTMSEKYWEEV